MTVDGCIAYLRERADVYMRRADVATVSEVKLRHRYAADVLLEATIELMKMRARASGGTVDASG